MHISLNTISSIILFFLCISIDICTILSFHKLVILTKMNREMTTAIHLTEKFHLINVTKPNT